MKEELFKKSMLYLQKLYGNVSDDLYKILWNVLKGYQEENFSKMVENVVKTFVPSSQVPFPLPAHFIKSIGADPKYLSNIAVTAVRNAARNIGNWHSVSFGDNALHATIERFGGWIKLCEWSDQEWSYNETRFIKAYEAELMHGVENGPDKLIGVFESHNAEQYDSFSEEQKKFADNANAISEINWVGNKLLISKYEHPELIENKQKHFKTEVH